MTAEEIENAWYSLGYRGVASANEWVVKYKFAREIEKLVKQELTIPRGRSPIPSQ